MQTGKEAAPFYLCYLSEYVMLVIESIAADVHSHSAGYVGIVALRCSHLTSHAMDSELFLHKRHTF